MNVNGSLIAAAVAVVGLMGNLIWMLINLRMESRIGAKIDALKDWMGERYVATHAFQGCQTLCAERHTELQKLCGERHAEVCRRLKELETRG